MNIEFTEKAHLENVQLWIKNLLMSRGSLPEKINRFEQEHQIPIADFVKHTRGVSPERRLDIYASGYVLRLLECLEADFPLLQKFLGPQLFQLFGKAYIVTIPSNSWSLYDYGKNFPVFLEVTQPESTEENRAMIELPTEIAKFERAKSVALLAQGTEDITFTRPLSGLFFAHFHSQTSFTAPECLQLLSFSYPILQLIESLENDNTMPNPILNTTYVAITRKQYRVQYYALESWQYDFLQACKNGLDTETIIQKFTVKFEISVDDLQAKLCLWLPMAMNCGLLY